MYGLLLDSIQKFLREKYGEHYWVVIRRRAKLSNHWFVTHEVYSDTVMSDLVDAAAATLGEPRDLVMQMFGEYFVQTIGRYGYARLLRVLGRDMRDFLNGLDDLHEYLRFSYPKMRPPSFFCENETPYGMIMHYTTKRRGYLPYVIGQLCAVGKTYQKDLKIEVMKESYTSEGVHVVLELLFDNSEFHRTRRSGSLNDSFSLSGDAFISIFPFCVVFDKELTIVTVGGKMEDVLPDVRGRRLDYVFTHRRPRNIILTWESILMHTNCSFELISIDPVARPLLQGTHSPSMQYTDMAPNLKLKGQMMLTQSREYIMFLCSPVMDSPEDLYQTGIFINDLAMHDSTREYILAGSQQNPELNLALNQEKIRTKQLEDSIQKTDELIYQMIPKQIADKLRSGETPLNTCKVFTSVSILFSDIVSFTPMCARLRPMEVVSLLNAMYVAFDHLCEVNHVYKVQTIGDAYMALAGAPVTTPHHAEYMTDFAFSIIEAIGKINDPSTQEPLQIRVGIHSGTVVAGIVGSKIFRYDVFGDTVNTAARMEATGIPMKIHISKATADHLEGTDFVIEERGEVELKGKGMMKTYWVLSKKTKNGTDKALNPLQKKKLSSLSPPKKGSIALSEIEDLLVKPTHKLRAGSPPLPCSREATSRLMRKYQSAQNTPRSSVAPRPEDWPAMDRLINGMKEEEEEEEEELARINDTPSPTPLPSFRAGARYSSTASLIPGLLHSRASIDLPNVRPCNGSIHNRTNESVFSVPEGLASLASENISTLKEFERIAEETAQSSRKLANWSHYISSIVQQRSVEASSNPSSTKPNHLPTPLAGRRATVATVTPQVTPTHTPTHLGSSVDPESSSEDEKSTEETSTKPTNITPPTNNNTAGVTTDASNNKFEMAHNHNNKENCIII